MLTSQRTRLLTRGHAEMLKFDPAEILPPLSPPIACVMGALRRNGESLNPGGFLPDTGIVFRVPRATDYPPRALNWTRAASNLFLLDEDGHDLVTDDRILVASSSSPPALPLGTYVVERIDDTIAAIQGLAAGDLVGTATIARVPVEFAIGTRLQWRVPGEESYRGTVRIDSIIDRPSVPYLVLVCVNPNK